MSVVYRATILYARSMGVRQLATVVTAREAGERLNLEHLEVIRRIRRGDIQAKKFGWNWTIEVDEITRVRETDWYQKLMARRAREATK